MNKNNLSSLITRIERLEAEVFGNKTRPNKVNEKKAIRKNTKLDFSINIRAFVKKFANEKGGPKKFVLLLAFITKGKVGQDVALIDIRKEWNRMSGKNMLGKFNRSYTNEAKIKCWVNTKKHGTYCLTENWQEIHE